MVGSLRSQTARVAKINWPAWPSARRLIYSAILVVYLGAAGYGAVWFQTHFERVEYHRTLTACPLRLYPHGDPRTVRGIDLREYAPEC